MIKALVVYLLAGLGAGVGTGLAGLSAAAVIAPMLITFLGFDAYEAVAIALASDVLASAASAWIYGKNRNLDIRNGLVMMIAVLVFTMIGSFTASLLPDQTMGNFSVIMTFVLGIKFLLFPVMATRESMAQKSLWRRAAESVACGAVIGFICGFTGAGGGMMMLLILTSVMHYELKTAVGTSVFIMSFTAFTGSVSHMVIGGLPDPGALFFCILFTFLFAKWAAGFANHAKAALLNRIVGGFLAALGVAMMVVRFC